MNKKLYIILTPTVSNMAGGQNYVNCKKHWLEENGWTVKVLCFDNSNILLKWLRDGVICHGALMYPTYFYNKLYRNYVVRNIVKSLKTDFYSEYVIESTTINISTWGELIAYKLNGKHLLYTLQEENTVSNRSVCNYLRFKYNRHEIAGIAPEAVQNLMKNIGCSCKNAKDFTLIAYNGNVVEDYDHSIIEKVLNLPHDYIICSIGRIDKPFVYPTIKSIISYIKNDEKSRYILLLIGDAPQKTGCKENIYNICNGIKNLSVVITGYMHPIPFKLLRLCDVSISSSGSASVSQKAGIPTISIDGIDHMPIGILGYNTNKRLYRENEPIYPLSYYLNIILKQKEYVKSAPLKPKEISFNDHLEYIKHGSITNDYFKISKLSWNKSQIIQKILVPLLGPKMYHSIIKLVKNGFKYNHTSIQCRKIY